MVTILLEKILSVLEGWSASFASFIIDLMTKLNLIETETANLPDIKTNTDNISSNTDSMTATLTNIKTDTGTISGKVNSIDSNTTIIKNNINTISTNVGTASAFCEDTANNTLEIVDKITTIASDTTQLRTNSNSITSDVSEIKNTLGLYLYNTIVTEDAEGSIANFDTDLKDYLQNAVVTIPADANGVSGINIITCAKNLFPVTSISGVASVVVNCFLRAGNYKLSTLVTSSDTDKTSSGIMAQFTDDTYDFVREIPRNVRSSIAFNPSKDVKKILFFASTNYAQSVGDTFSYNNVQIEYGLDVTDFETYDHNDNIITFSTPITDGAEVDLLSGVVKINTSPVTYDSITPLAIRTYKGVNNIYSDIGDMSLTYRETLKHYLEKQNS